MGGIECVGAPPRRRWRRRRWLNWLASRRRRLRRRTSLCRCGAGRPGAAASALLLESEFDVFLKALDLLLELLIAKLQLLDHSGELAVLIFQSVHPHRQIRRDSLGLTLTRRLAAEHSVERPGILSKRRAAAHQQIG